jgi:hypothetical protein
MRDFLIGGLLALLLVSILDTRIYAMVVRLLERPAPAWWRRLINR